MMECVQLHFVIVVKVKKITVRMKKNKMLKSLSAYSINHLKCTKVYIHRY